MLPDHGRKVEVFSWAAKMFFQFFVPYDKIRMKVNPYG